jgi:hypothetical protein
MGDNERDDAVDALLRSSATWEPPDGFVLRVIAASRADDRKETSVPLSLAHIGAMDRIRTRLRALAARREGAAWVIRQYWLLLRGR